MPSKSDRNALDRNDFDLSWNSKSDRSTFSDHHALNSRISCKETEREREREKIDFRISFFVK